MAGSTIEGPKKSKVGQRVFRQSTVKERKKEWGARFQIELVVDIHTNLIEYGINGTAFYAMM